MKLSVIGTGYVGLVTGACFAEMGNKVICIDNDFEKIQSLREGIIPIYEPGLEGIVKSNHDAGDLVFSTDIKEAMEKTNICFIAVGTPMNEDGGANLDYVLNVAKAIGQNMTHHMYVVDKSTVPVGTADRVRKTIQNELDKRGSKLTFEVISNPEFLKEGAAIDDCMKPDRIVVGAESDKAVDVMKELYTPFVRNTERFIVMDIKSAEMTKYAANAMLATKISFINEMANICERVGADVNKVRIGIGSDSRIGYSFIYPGCGYGGSCFPKDVQALIKTARDYGYHPKILESVETVNLTQKRVLVDKVVKRFGNDLRGRIFALWGLSFKPSTDDMREAPSITIIRKLVEMGAKIKAYDPKAIEESKVVMKEYEENVEYCNSKYTVLNNSDALILVTEWKEFRSPDFEEMGKRLKNKIIYDGRNQYKKETLLEQGFEYYQIGVGI